MALAKASEIELSVALAWWMLAAVDAWLSRCTHIEHSPRKMSHLAEERQTRLSHKGQLRRERDGWWQMSQRKLVLVVVLLLVCVEGGRVCVVAALEERGRLG
jgi:hypothetical protein